MRLCLIIEMIVFGYIYLCGKNGIQSLHMHKELVFKMEKDIARLNQEIGTLEHEIYLWQHDDFYKEKVAREQLQMARKNDELFYVGT